MDILFLIGRVLFGGFFIMNGINHFKNLGSMTGYAKSKRVPSPKFAVILSGLFILLGGLGVLLGVYVMTSLWLIFIFLLVVSVMMHDFWTMKGDDKMAEKINFMKNMALLGASLLLMHLPLPWVYSLSF